MAGWIARINNFSESHFTVSTNDDRWKQINLLHSTTRLVQPSHQPAVSVPKLIKVLPIPPAWSGCWRPCSGRD
jgi:hypothetical protein